MNWELPLWALLLTTPLMMGLWLGYRWVHRNASLADVGFCMGFGLVAVHFGLTTTGDASHRLVVAVMATGYAIRLATHILVNRVLGTGEDQRYQSLRERWGNWAEFYFFLYFVGQAVAVAVLSIPLLVLMSNPDPTWHVGEVVGVVVWALGVGGEAVADDLLTRFRRDPGNRGKTCRWGPWRYSRHPNYFFEGVHWCAYVVMGDRVARLVADPARPVHHDRSLA